MRSGGISHDAQITAVFRAKRRRIAAEVIRDPLFLLAFVIRFG